VTDSGARQNYPPLENNNFSVSTLFPSATMEDFLTFYSSATKVDPVSDPRTMFSPISPDLHPFIGEYPDSEINESPPTGAGEQPPLSPPGAW